MIPWTILNFWTIMILWTILNFRRMLILSTTPILSTMPILLMTMILFSTMIPSTILMLLTIWRMMNLISFLSQTNSSRMMNCRRVPPFPCQFHPLLNRDRQICSNTPNILRPRPRHSRRRNTKIDNRRPYPSRFLSRFLSHFLSRFWMICYFSWMI